MSLLGQIVAKISGMPYDKYVEENILKPLQLKDTRPFMPENLWGNKLATGYGGLRRDGSRRTMPFFQANGIAPAAGFSSSALDLARFAQWQLRLLNSTTKELLKPSTLKEMQRVQWIDPNGDVTFGLGFVVENVDGSKIAGHDGSCPGYRTSVTIQPKSKIGVVVMVNAAGVNAGNYSDVIMKILNRYSDSKTEKSSVNLADYAGRYDGTDWGSESVYLPWKGQLITFGLPTASPINERPRLFKPTSTPGDFRAVRQDELQGQLIQFERDSNGKVKRVVYNSNYSEKMK